MGECNSIKTPMENNATFPGQTPLMKESKLFRSAIGSFMFAATNTRPDISFAVCTLAQKMAASREEHWSAVKRIFRYLESTLDYALCFDGIADSINLERFADASWAGDDSDRNSVTGFTFRVGNKFVSWKSKKQATVAKITTEAEYIALSAAVSEGI